MDCGLLWKIVFILEPYVGYYTQEPALWDGGVCLLRRGFVREAIFLNRSVTKIIWRLCASCYILFIATLTQAAFQQAPGSVRNGSGAGRGGTSHIWRGSGRGSVVYRIPKTICAEDNAFLIDSHRIIFCTRFYTVPCRHGQQFQTYDIDHHLNERWDWRAGCWCCCH